MQTHIICVAYARNFVQYSHKPAFGEQEKCDQGPFHRVSTDIHQLSVLTLGENVVTYRGIC